MLLWLDCEGMTIYLKGINVDDRYKYHIWSYNDKNQISFFLYSIEGNL